MKRFQIASLLLLLFTACNTATPENYFDRAVLNTNLINDFASDQATRMLTDYSAASENAKAQNMSAVKWNEMKVASVEKALKDVKGLKETDETREMLQTSVALFEYVLPVYKNEYVELAKLSDKGEDITSKAQELNNKYGEQFETLLAKLSAIGKKYADDHGIKVNWGK